jgi:hypothetical protein
MKLDEMKSRALILWLALLSLTVFTSRVFAQDDVSYINKSKVAASGAKASDFVPTGWKIEAEAKGDVNSDKWEGVQHWRK